MSDKHSLHIAAILSHKWPTCTVSVTCFRPLFVRWHRICFSLPCYIFITAEPCWYSALRRTKNMRTCAGSGKHDLTRVVEREDSQRSKHCCSSQGKCQRVPEAIEWPHQAIYRAEGNLLTTPTSSPALTRQLEIGRSSSIQSRAVYVPAGFHSSTTLQQTISLIRSWSLAEGVLWNQLMLCLVVMKTSTRKGSQWPMKVHNSYAEFRLFTVHGYSKWHTMQHKFVTW